MAHGGRMTACADGIGHQFFGKRLHYIFNNSYDTKDIAYPFADSCLNKGSMVSVEPWGRYRRRKLNNDMKKLLVMTALMSVSLTLGAQSWIWYLGDMDIWIGNKVNNLRTERGAFYPPFWKTYGHEQTVEFIKSVDLSAPEEIELAVEGHYSVKIDNRYQFGMPNRVTIPAGRHTIRIAVNNLVSPPAVWVKGETIVSDSTWQASDYGAVWAADTWKDGQGQSMFTDRLSPPSRYALHCSTVSPIKTEPVAGGHFLEWSREGIGYLMLHGVKGNGRVSIHYGESSDEARDRDHSITLDELDFTRDSVTDLALRVSSPRSADYRLQSSRAMRYALVELAEGISVDSITLQAEMKDIPLRGSFSCSDPLLNRIWEVSAYTLHLTDREVFIEGIKRDRWTWSGDAIQSYLMSYYSHFDAPTVKRTIWLMRGKDPIEKHLNTILDYTFYWFNSIYDYYLYTGDSQFVCQIYPRMQSLMDFVLRRVNSRGMVEGQKGDWVFVDWSPRNMSKQGELAVEQILFCKSLETMRLCADIVGNEAAQQMFASLHEELREKLIPTFWNEEKQALMHTVVNGRQTDEVTRYANIFGTLYDYLDKNRQQSILHSVLLNDSVMEITTPYMRFYELETLCALGQQRHVLSEMRSYWGGMLSQGATTFWETYDPKEGYPERLAMYGNRYGKSLCHAWGASPIYLLGKYFLGISPVKPGYEEWEARPCLGDLKWMKGDVPTPHGRIHLEMTRNSITIQSDGGIGWVYFHSSSKPRTDSDSIESLGNNEYRVRMVGKAEAQVRGIR